MKKVVFMGIALCLAFVLVACGNQTGNVPSPENNEDEISKLETEIDSLETEIENLKTENERLKEQLDKKEKEETVQDSDVTVLLTGKSTHTGEFADIQMYVDFVFSVTNNTDKPIKGVQGIAHFRDIFDVDIMNINCDFTGTTIDPGATITDDDLYFDCNKYIDDHMKLYTTAYDDLHFEYTVTAIVFSDGTTKTNT